MGLHFATTGRTVATTADERPRARLGRRDALRLAIGGGIAACLASPALAAIPARDAPAEDQQEWQSFKRRFMRPEGRIADTGNGGVSHTEGQGWGLLFAVAHDDIDAFDRLLAWTQSNLARPDDTLHAWRWVPGAVNHVPDRNNATDGDVFIAAALGRAAARWNRPDLHSAATAMAGDILRLLVREVGGRTVLLPGAEGFCQDGMATVNPSYYAFPLLAELAQLAPSPIWDNLRRDGLDLVSRGRFGPWRLPPDWLHVARDGTLSPSPEHPARFSYDAIRVPLWLAWADAPVAAPRQDFDAFWTAHAGGHPAWIDLVTDQSAPWSAPPGMVAVARVAAAASERAPLARMPQVAAAPDYYSAALILLSRLAWRETVRV